MLMEVSPKVGLKVFLLEEKGLQGKSFLENPLSIVYETSICGFSNFKHFVKHFIFLEPLFDENYF